MGFVVAIGGASSRRNFRKLARFALSFSRKKYPKVLIIPTASSDDGKYVEFMSKSFRKFLGCRTDVLFLLGGAPSVSEIRRKILSSDVIYVAGGNTLKMMRRWRKLRVDFFLREAYKKNIVLFGASAGAICWFDYGHSDSMSYYNKEHWDYVLVKGLGIFPGLACPHYHGEKRVSSFRKSVFKTGFLGVAIDNDAAFVVKNGSCFGVSVKSGSGVFKVIKLKNKVISDGVGEDPVKLIDFFS